MHDWDGLRRAMIDDWIVIPDRPGREPDPEQRLVWLHLQALSQLAHLADPTVTIDETLTADALYAALEAAVPIRSSVVYDLRELLDFLTRLDEEQGPHPFPAGSLPVYAERVCAALELSTATFTWRLSTNRNRFVPTFTIGVPPPLPLAS